MANGAPLGGPTGSKTVFTFFAALVVALGGVLVSFEPLARGPAAGSQSPSISASREYERIWKQDRRYFGDQDMPAPNMLFVANGEGFTTTGAEGDQWGAPRIINIGLTARRQLTSGKLQPRNSVRFAIEHEFGRYFGPDLPLVSGGGNAGAGLANLVANSLVHTRNTGRGDPSRILHNKLPYWGQNPATIMFPKQPAAPQDAL
jgi:hypothetical protein